MQFAQALRLAVVAAAAVGIGASVLVSSPGQAVATAEKGNVKITERDFRITAPKRLAPGEVTLSITNNGPDTHELIVVRARGKSLPLRTDGLTVNEERLQERIVGVLEPRSAGTTHTLRLHLVPGRYVLLCNMAGHYLGGMHTQVVVR